MAEGATLHTSRTQNSPGVSDFQSKEVMNQQPRDSETRPQQNSRVRQQKEERGNRTNSTASVAKKREVFTVRPSSQTRRRKEGGRRQRGDSRRRETEETEPSREPRRNDEGDINKRMPDGKVSDSHPENNRRDQDGIVLTRGRGRGGDKDTPKTEPSPHRSPATKSKDPNSLRSRARKQRQAIADCRPSPGNGDGTAGFMSDDAQVVGPPDSRVKVRSKQSRNRDHRPRATERNWREKSAGEDGERETNSLSLAADVMKPQEQVDAENTKKQNDREREKSHKKPYHLAPKRTKDKQVSPNRDHRPRATERNWREKSAEEDCERETNSLSLAADVMKAQEQVEAENTKKQNDREREKSHKKPYHLAPKRTKDKQVSPTLQSSELTQQLSAGSYSCMVCCERVRARDAVWSCRECYHVFHLECVRKWATSPASLLNEKEPTEGWRCPACQNASRIVPTLYKCYCGKLTNPRPRSKGDLTAPHSCGDLCGQNLARTPQSLCHHKCQLLCHPGPCPPCPVMVARSCPCGRQTYQVRCSKTGDLPSCGSVCGRKLTCGRHHCDLECHAGSCPVCEVLLTQQCHCGRSQRGVVCGEEREDTFECGRTCGKELDCGNHLCELACHPSLCPSCPLLPAQVTTCPCGDTPLCVLVSPDCSRSSCLDPVPTCDHTCGKQLPCSTRAEPHFCPIKCHEGLCPPCEKSRVVKCLCGKGNTRVDCQDLAGMGEYVCEKPCNKMKSCGRHRCSNRCCVDASHHCDLVCGKRLQCGNHNCTEVCHKGHCNQCWEYSYEELTCHCGAEVLLPPLACGTKPPACNRVCAKMHACQHPVTHSCHSEEECPPCTVLTVKMCMGEHEERHNIPCHITDVTCGVACGKMLPCNNHKCQRICHCGVCMESAGLCRQPCQSRRKYCSHECGEPCHVGTECPDTPCKAEVILTCKCGRRKERTVCGASSSGVMQQAFHKILSKDLGAKIRDLQSGQSVSLGHVTLASLGRDSGETLECDEVCLQVERNRTLATALGVSSAVINPLDPPLPKYPASLMELARNNTALSASAEEELKSFVEMVMKGTAVQARRHRFSPMFSSERKLLHELAPHYGCDSLSHDTEPQRYVTVSTKKSVAKLPSVPLMKMIDKERLMKSVTPTPINLPPERGSLKAKISTGGSLLVKEIDKEVAKTDYFADDLIN